MMMKNQKDNLSQAWCKDQLVGFGKVWKDFLILRKKSK